MPARIRLITVSKYQRLVFLRSVIVFVMCVSDKQCRIFRSLNIRDSIRSYSHLSPLGFLSFKLLQALLPPSYTPWPPPPAFFGFVGLDDLPLYAASFALEYFGS